MRTLRKISYRTAINEALDEEMKIDKNVFVYGIDAGDFKSIFGSTYGLQKKYGKDRCFSTPLCEDSLVGFGLGAAISGLRPVNVHIRVDFLLLAMNQIANMVSSFHYGSAGKLKVPLVIRAIIGKGWGQTFQHSKSLHSFFAHLPGLKVIMPTTVADAKGLLKSSIQDDNPVIFIEHRMLYDVEGEIDFTSGSNYIPIGKGNILKRGNDITIVATSYKNVEALKAAEILGKQGVSTEIIDPRTIYPLDIDLIVSSVNKTGHLIIADYDWTFCGFGAEIAAQVSARCFGKLKSPISRIGFAPVPCPSSRILENEFYGNSVSIIREIENKLKLKKTDLSGETFYSYENKFKGPF